MTTSVDEIKKPKGDAVTQDSLKKKESNLQTTPRNYTEAEHLKGIEDAIAQYGDKIKRERIDPITTERDSLKSQVSNNTTDLADNKTEIEKLRARVSDLTSEDPEKFKAVTKLNEAEDERTRLKGVERELATREVSLAESKNEMVAWKRDQLVYTVADEYVTADGKDVSPDSFKLAADKFNLSDKEALVSLAETMGLKPKIALPVSAPLTPYKVVTDGGSDNIAGMSPKDRVKEADRRQRV